MPAEEARLLNDEQESKLARAELLTKKAVGAFRSLNKGDEHYGIRYAEVLRDISCAYRLAYESKGFDPGATVVMRQIEEFSQVNQFALKVEGVKLPGLETVSVVIDTAPSEI